MPVAVELFLDDASAEAVRGVWRQIADAGISSYLASSGIRPHLTLAVGDSLDEAAVTSVLRDWAATTAPFQVRIANLGLTPAQQTSIFFAPIITTKLLALHADLHGKLTGLITRPWERYLPGRWDPHTTLVERLPAEHIGPTLDLARKATLPFEAHLAEIGIVEFSPLRPVVSFPLTGPM